jgi:two-component system, NtrC family, sensor histidine kinase PilS
MARRIGFVKEDEVTRTDELASVAPAPGRFIFIRGLVGLLAAAVIALQGFWNQNPQPVTTTALALVGWLAVSSLLCLVWHRLHSHSSGLIRVALFGDCIAMAAVVWATGSLHSPTLLLLALPVLAGGLLFCWGTGVMLGLFTAMLYGLLAMNQMQRGMLPGQLWSLVIFHTLTFTAMGAAAGLLSARIAASARDAAASALDAAASRSELRVVRMSTDRIIASLGVGVLVVDGAGLLVSTNRESERLLQIDGTDLGTPISESRLPSALVDIINSSLSASLLASTNSTIQDTASGATKIREQELNLPGSDGIEVPVLIKPALMGDETLGPEGVAILLWDLTERERQEAQIRRREQLAMIGELSAGLAHEIRNSLKPITGSIELLKHGAQKGVNTDEMMELITTESRSLEAFLSQFLTLARDKTLKFEAINLEDLIRREVRAIAVSRANGDGSIPFRSTCDTCIQGDREWLRQVFRNGLLNAFEADPEGAVQANCETFERDGRPWILVRIMDCGPGVQAEDAEDVFGPFQTTKLSGTGLGLPIARRGVEEHGGRIYFDTSWSRGACMVVELPVSGPPAADEVDRVA